MNTQHTPLAPRRSSRLAPEESTTVADSGLRMRHLLGGFALCVALVFARLVLLECTEGQAFRAEAAKPLEKTRALPGVRGRIISADGQLLAADRRLASVAVNYRYLEDPPSGRWLRRQARARVPRDVPDRAARYAAEQAWVATYRATLLDNLAQLCGRPLGELEQASADIQSRVRSVSATVNQARHAQAVAENEAAQTAAGHDPWRRALSIAPAWLFAPDEAREPPHVVVAEELDYHVVVPDVPLEVVAEIESHPELYPGVRIVEQSRRSYPHASLASNILGHVGLGEPDDAAEASREHAATNTNAGDKHKKGAHGKASAQPPLVGRMGTERQAEKSLRGRDGELVDETDHSGRWLRSTRVSEPASGHDVRLTLRADVQRVAEELLDRAAAHSQNTNAHGRHGARGTTRGAIVVLDVRTGAIVAAATAPRFDPNHFADRNAAAIARLLDDPAHPLFDRTTKMAIPPGSVFKIVTALALGDDAEFDPRARIECQGFLTQPDRLRCQIYRRYGEGHGPVDLADALAQSCNVYFFHHAETLGPQRIGDWAARLGLGQPTGVDLPGESAGFVPSPAAPGAAERKWQLADTQALAIGQSTLRTTPLQIARLIAAIGNGGRLVTPHVVARADDLRSYDTSHTIDEGALRDPPFAPDAAPVRGLESRQLEAVRRGLKRVVADPQGTAYAALSDSEVPVAGKTGTAETGERSADHAWFAGYTPADAPQFALVAALEHQGSAEQAATLVKELVRSMHARGMLHERATVNDVAGP